MTTYQLPDSAEMLRFRKNEQAVTQLAALMSDPVFRDALKIVGDLARPTHLPETTPGIHPDTCVTHHHHLLIGITTALTKLKKLTLPILPGSLELDDPEREEFMDHLPEELR
jgi:hypothetical protein